MVQAAKQTTTPPRVPNPDLFNNPITEGSTVIIPDTEEPEDSDKPTGLSVTLTDGKAVLTWTDPGEDADVTGYNIYRSFHIDYLVTLAVINEKVTTHTDTWPTQGQINVYVIQAIKADGVSDLSDPVYIAPPAQPENLSASVDMSGVTLTWEQPEMLDWINATDPVITGYQILRGTSPDNLTVLKDDTESADTSYSDTTTRPSGGVYYAVRAKTAVGLSLPSEPLLADVPDPVDAFDGNTLILVSNWEQSRKNTAVTTDNNVVSEPFQTGPSAAGYYLTELTLDFAAVSGQADLTMSIHSDDQDSPGTKISNLTAPANLTTGTNIFTALPAIINLVSNTKYWIVLQNTPGSTGHVDIWLAGNGGKDDTTARGFRFFQRDPRHNPAAPIRMIIKGHDIDDIPARPETTRQIRPGETVQSFIHGYGDRDWFRIRLQAGVIYRFDDAVSRLNQATVLAIYDKDGTRQDVHKTFIPFPDNIRYVYFTPATAGDYYVSAGVLGAPLEPQRPTGAPQPRRLRLPACPWATRKPRR